MRKLLSGTWLLCSLSLTACGPEPEGLSPEEEAEEMLIQETFNLKGQRVREVRVEGPLTAFADPYGDGTDNPAQKAWVRVRAWAVKDRFTLISLTVAGAAPNRQFGAHVHKLPCADTKGGGHYQHVVSPTTPTDPAYANPKNEVWLDFLTNRKGHGFAWSLVNWTVRPDGANSIVVHHTKTANDGTAGARLGCKDVDF
jgi:superoxide dismutase, Cu-Zn family